MEILAGLIFGILGGVHCVGMCGPIVISLAMVSPQRRGWLQFFYHFGRLVSYSVLGGVVGLVGWGFALVGWQGWLSIFAGVGMLVGVCFSGVGSGLEWGGFFRSKWNFWLRRRSYGAFFAVGVLNGFLPCGLLYMALASALTLGSVWKAAFFMFLFGVGTTPYLAALFWGSGRFSRRFSLRWQRWLVILVAGLLILRGLGLGIPYLSPGWESRGNIRCGCHG